MPRPTHAERDRKIFEGWSKGQSLRQLAERFDLTESRIRGLIRREGLREEYRKLHPGEEDWRRGRGST